MSNEMAGTTEEIKNRADDWMNEVDTAKVKQEAKGILAEVEKLPDTAYVGAVVGSIALSLLLFLLKKQTLGIFVGLWPPTLASMAWLLKERRPSKDISP